jgi:hypothetical protein
LAYSKAPVAQAKEKVGDSGSATQSTQTDKRGTPESPLMVNARTIHSDDEAAEEKRENAEHERTDRWIIGLTIAIAICAFLQFCGIVAQVVVYLKQTQGYAGW